MDGEKGQVLGENVRFITLFCMLQFSQQRMNPVRKDGRHDTGRNTHAPEKKTHQLEAISARLPDAAAGLGVFYH